MCVIPDEYEHLINILLNYLYTNKQKYGDVDIMKLISFFDFIGYFYLVCKLITKVYKKMFFEEYIQVTEYITNKKIH